MAFVARYGHQQMPHILDMAITELVFLSRDLADLINQENRLPSAEG